MSIYRHGTLSLYAALDVRTRKVAGKTAKRHTSEEFLDFLTTLVNKARWAREIHIVLDNLSEHKTKAVEQFLAEHPKVHFHFTPTYCRSRKCDWPTATTERILERTASSQGCIAGTRNGNSSIGSALAGDVVARHPSINGHFYRTEPSLRCSTLVPVMEATDLRNGDDTADIRWLDGPRFWRVFPQP